MRNVKEPLSKFLRIVCSSCNAEQIVFGKVSTRVVCNSCGKPIAKSSGGKSIVFAKVKEVL